VLLSYLVDMPHQPRIMNTREERMISAPTIDIAIKRSTQCTVSKGLTDLLSDLFAAHG
jgi:hypothetical protein